MRIHSLSALFLAAALVGCGDYTSVVIIKTASTPAANANAGTWDTTPPAEDSSDTIDATNLDADNLISDTY